MDNVTLRPLADLGLNAASASADITPLELIATTGWNQWHEAASPAEQRWIADQNFTGKAGQALCFPGADGGVGKAIGMIGTSPIWDGASLAEALAHRQWHLTGDVVDTATREQVALGWALAQYRFDSYRNGEHSASHNALMLADISPRLAGLACGTALCRDLINTPPNHMNPAGLETAARNVASQFDASINVISGDELRMEFPAINTVGRAAEVGPRLIDMHWGDSGPKITLVGKGITFDSGGLDLKPSKAMEMMKKDMGGAATVLGLATALMQAGTKIQLRVLIPAAENAVSDKAMRPLDVIDTRAGLKVEVGNTDAEGRLVLADALTLALDDKPDFLIDFATLTGAARVALGTELPALFCNDDDTAAAIIAASAGADDPLWRLPLFEPYDRFLEGGYVTLSSTGASGYGGAITAALFLRKFAGAETNWAHIDVMAWNLGSRPGRPKGGEAMGMRAIFSYIEGLAGAS